MQAASDLVLIIQQQGFGWPPCSRHGQRVGRDSLVHRSFVALAWYIQHPQKVMDFDRYEVFWGYKVSITEGESKAAPVWLPETSRHQQQ